jgi:signal transduction histidine kinase
VNLQAAGGLLGAGTLPADNPELAKAIECIDRAGTLTREGLAAARRAVLALRDDTASLPDQLSSLAGQYGADGNMAVDFAVAGEARPVSAEAGLAAYRTAQEALTNARKHAPGQPVTLRLGFEDTQITVSVVNPLSPQRAQTPLADTGAGYGLVGLRERAALARGTFEAGPDAGNWQVNLRIPA